jgi:precorrin-6A synthase
MLDGDCAFKSFPEKASEIYWGAYLGMDRQILGSGRLAEAANEIEATRGAARAQYGWIMDCYLLRRPPASRPSDPETAPEGQR